MKTTTLAVEDVSTEELTALKEFATNLPPESSLRKFLLSMVGSLENGDSIVLYAMHTHLRRPNDQDADFYSDRLDVSNRTVLALAHDLGT